MNRRFGLQGFHSAQGSVAESPVQSPQPYQYHYCLHNQQTNGSFFDFEHLRKTRSHYKDALETVTLHMI